MKIKAKTVRYIKLGKKKGGWEIASLERGELHFGYGGVSHELALMGDAKKIKQQQISKGKTPQVAGSVAQQVLDFYQLGSDCLWITFAREHLWWTFAEPEVTWHGPPTHASRRADAQHHRRLAGSWPNSIGCDGVTASKRQSF